MLEKLEESIKDPSLNCDLIALEDQVRDFAFMSFARTPFSAPALDPQYWHYKQNIHNVMTDPSRLHSLDSMREKLDRCNFFFTKFGTAPNISSTIEFLEYEKGP